MELSIVGNDCESSFIIKHPDGFMFQDAATSLASVTDVGIEGVSHNDRANWRHTQTYLSNN